MQEAATELCSHRGNDRKIEKFIFNSVLISSHPELNMSLSTTRLRKELRELQKNPLQHIRAAPKETNILEWHYVIIGQEKTLYEGGYYYGTVVFPSEYPFKPPTIRMMTPSGRFKVGIKIEIVNDEWLMNYCPHCSLERDYACQCLIFIPKLGTQW
jgi:hypothetical protein